MSSWSLPFLILIPALGFGLGGCGLETRSVEDYSLEQISQIVLTEQNHPRGYGQSECFHCHVEINIHQQARLSPVQAELARRLVRQNGLQSCVGCHGKNGVNNP